MVGISDAALLGMVEVHPYNHLFLVPQGSVCTARAYVTETYCETGSDSHQGLHPWAVIEKKDKGGTGSLRRSGTHKDTV